MKERFLEIAESLGLTGREYVALAEADKRIIDPRVLATEHARHRLRLWLAAGRPDARAEDVHFRGDDSVRAVIVETLAALPVPIRWHACTRVMWFEIGRGSASGYFTCVRPPSTTDDSAHVIVIDGRERDADWPAIVCHELAHAIHQPVRSPEATPPPRMPDVERNARLVAAFGDEAAVRILFRPEQLANAAASAWGFSCTDFAPDDLRLRQARAYVRAASGLAKNISDEIDAKIEADMAAGAVAAAARIPKERP